jgi:hypothetical protein
MKGRKLSSKEEKEKLQASADYRRKVFKELLAHIKQGYSLDCFGPISLSCIKEYLKTYPEQFCGDELEEAQRQAKTGWETLGRKQADGTCLGNSRSWYYNMANRYGWAEKQEVKQEHSGGVSVNIVSYASTKTPTP